MVVDDESNVLVGFTAVGPDVAELLHAATAAITGEVPLKRPDPGARCNPHFHHHKHLTRNFDGFHMNADTTINEFA